MNPPEDLDIELFVISVDPDWKSHPEFIDIEHAYDFYMKCLDPKQIADAIKEAR